MDSFKRSLKGMFKREKKSKQEKDPYAYLQHDDTVKSRDWAAKPPQIPPVNQASPLQSPAAAEPTKALPPTHPLATGQHSEPQEAVPQNHDAKPGPPTPIDTTAVTSTGKSVARPADAAAVDSKTEEDGTPSDTKAATVTTDAAAAPATNASTTPAQQAATESAVSSAPNGVHEQSNIVDSAVHDAATDTSSKENVQPQAAATTAGEKTQSTHEQPPPIKAIKVAPGMSATSGPLEDFPEGGEALREE